MIIAIDGESASGKGTLAKLLAKELSCTYLNTGLLYRAVAYLANQAQALTDANELLNIAQSLSLQNLEQLSLSGNEIAVLASKIAVIPEIRNALLQLQRDFAINSYKNLALKGAVLDGRDIGTVVCPQSDYKFFIIADLSVRAKRRWQDLQKNLNASKMSYEEVYESLKKRDWTDAHREHSALKPAKDAIIINNTKLGIEATLSLMLSYITTNK